MSRGKGLARTLIALFISSLCVNMVHASIPDATVVIKDKAYALEYA